MRYIKGRRIFEIFLILVFSFGVSILNSLHVIIQWIANPSDRIFTGIAHYFGDYFLYVSQMAQGALGSWIWATHQFTNESMPKTWIYWFNVTLGHLGSFIGFSPFATYNVALLILCIFLLILWYMVLCHLFPKNQLKRIISFLFLATATSFYNIPLLIRLRQLELLGQFWYSPTTAFNRLGGVPHQIFQSILLLFLILSYATLLKRMRDVSKKSLIVSYLFIGTLTFITATANPIQIIPLVLSAGLVTIAIGIKEKTNRLSYLGLLISCGLAGLFGTIITTNHFKTITVLEIARIWDFTHQVPMSIRTFILSVGPIMLFIPFGIKKWFRNSSPLHKILFFYGSLSLAIYASPLPLILSTQRLRWIHPMPYVLLPLLASEGVFILAQFFHTRLRISKLGIMSFIISIYLAFTLPSLFSEIEQRISPEKNILILAETEYNHVPQSTVTALVWLKQQKSNRDTSVILTDPKYSIEILVPVFTNKISFTGHPIHTLYPENKEELRKQFFNGGMSPSQAQTFLRNHRIGFILAAPVLQNTTLFASYPFLSTVFTNDRVMIEQVKFE